MLIVERKKNRVEMFVHYQALDIVHDPNNFDVVMPTIVIISKHTIASKFVSNVFHTWRTI